MRRRAPRHPENDGCVTYWHAPIVRHSRTTEAARKRRRRAVMLMVCGGTSIKDIADELDLKPQTIYVYLRMYGHFVTAKHGDLHRTYWLFGRAYPELDLPDWLPAMASWHFDRALFVRLCREGIFQDE